MLPGSREVAGQVLKPGVADPSAPTTGLRRCREAQDVGVSERGETGPEARDHGSPGRQGRQPMGPEPRWQGADGPWQGSRKRGSWPQEEEENWEIWGPRCPALGWCWEQGSGGGRGHSQAEWKEHWRRCGSRGKSPSAGAVPGPTSHPRQGGSLEALPRGTVVSQRSHMGGGLRAVAPSGGLSAPAPPLGILPPLLENN